MAKNLRYDGPADNLEWPPGSGKYYKRGEDVPIPEREALHLAVETGHQFSDIKEDRLAEAAASRTVAPRDLPPMDDAGRPMDNKRKPDEEAVAAVSAPATTMAGSGAPQRVEAKDDKS